MDPDAFQQDYQRWLNRFLNRPQGDWNAEVLRLLEIENLEHMWALPEREEP